MLGGTAGSIDFRLALAVDREGKPRAIIIRETGKLIWLGAASGARIRGTHRWLAPASHGRRGCKDSASGHRGLGLAGVMLVCIAYVICTVLLVPGVPLTLAVAVAYGWWALLSCLPAG